jgi:dTMP kinase
MKGIFITFEGLDGSGKTTQIEKLNDYLSACGYEVVLTIEPGGTPIGDKIRDILLDPENKGMSYKTELLLFEASRAELVLRIIKPAIDSGKIVICDRFFDSTIVYQGIARNLGIEKVYDMSLWATSGIEPDLTFLLSLDAASSEDRLDSQQKKRDRIEHEEGAFKEKLQEGYLEVAKKFPERFTVIDASMAVDRIFQQIYRKVEELLRKRD